MNWIIQNLSTIIIAVIIFIILLLIIRKIYLDKRNHKTSCGSSCAGCALAEKCHSVDNEKINS